MVAITLNPAAAGLAPYPMSELQAAAARLRSEGRNIFDFTIGDPLEPTPDFIRRALLDSLEEVSQYPTVVGQPALRSAAAGWVKRRLAIEVDPDAEVLPTAGSKEAVFHFPLLAVDPSSPKRAVLYGEPGYPVYERGAALAGGAPMAMPLTAESGFLLEPWLLSADAQSRVTMVWINYPHNPTGATATLDDLRRLLDWCREHDAVLCSDECYIDTYYEGEEPPASVLQAAADDNSGVLAFFSCSKRSGMTGYRSGFVAGDRALVGAYARLRPSFGTASQDFVQQAAVAAWSDDRHAARRREIFTAKRQVLCDLFADIGVEVVASRAAFYLWLRVPGGLTTEEWCAHLLEGGILVTPGESFGPSGEGFVRMALVPTLEGCHMAAQAWRELEAS